MHELSLTQSIVDICVKHARGHIVSKVTIEVGALSGVVSDSVEFCFEACAKGTLLEGAQLIVEKIPALASCSSCGSTFAIRALQDPCPKCQNFPVEVIQGREFRVREIDVEGE